MAGNSNAKTKAPKKGSNLLCRISNPTPKKVCEFVRRMPKHKMPEVQFRRIMGKEWFANEHQAPEQWGLYYIDGEYFYPRFNREISLKEAEIYLSGWLKRFIVINPYTQFKTSNDNGLVLSIVQQLEQNPNVNDLKTIMTKIIGNQEPFVINDILVNTLNTYSEVLNITIQDKNNEIFTVNLVPNYKEIINKKYNMTKKEYFELFDGIEIDFDPNMPLQQITYGAPGTGKSHGIKEATKGHSVIRTTFHPDSDYSTFVGAYKPVMEEVDARVVPVVLNNGASFDQNNGTFKEKRISYKFVKQAFLKAYLSAWKKYAKGVGAKSNIPTAQNTSVASSLTVSTNSGFYTLTGISSDRIFFKRDFEIKKSNVQNVWNRIWSNGSFTIPTGTQPGMSLQFCICDWINKNITNSTSNDFEKGWTLFMERLQNSPFEHRLNRQTYEFSLSNVVDTVHVQTKNNASTRKTLQDRFANFTDNSDLSSVEDGICSLLNNEDHDFDAAWSKLQDKIQQSNAVLSSSGGVDNIEPQFLIIEEINRGNCAQIFGDLFQLLDRNDENGFSTYPIDADTDLQKEIEKAFKEDKDGDSENPYKLLNDIDVEGAVEDYTSNYGASLSEDIQEGRVLLLPPNLYIWATMNTSDQSLFPIDSAFKRRWAWDYVKITDGKKGWKIQGDGYSCDWWTFIQEVNEKIHEATSSDDKKLGYYFCKAKDGTIDEKLFVSKVIFYLWNDVFKDNDNTIFKVTESSDEPSFDDFYMENEDGEIVTNPSAVKQFLANVVEEKNVTTDQSQTDEAEQSAQPVDRDSETQTTE